ncbi:MAG TPA: gephyrin-like molybdotransferase Glp [Solirubrobacteraceae bacterium]|jgi:molybdopterin molybdotransferase|nr:gephyrin-like molybdotransferase Glp [Solirubrobacteraceae bacterium]
MTPRLVSIAEAGEQILAAVDPLPEERVPIEDALDRVLARDVAAAGDVPPFASAAMDGYAVLAGPAGRTLRVVGESRAGVPSPLTVGSSEAVRTSTGAELPAGANAVIRQEQVEARGDEVTLRACVEVADDIRHRGEDLAAGVCVLGAGTTLGAAELAGAVAAGASELWCARRPRVAILCTGTELRAPGEPLGPGEIHNANAVTLRALATRCGALSAPALRLADDPATIETALAAALAHSDVVVLTGGVSVGPHDHVKPALDALGVEERFWGVAIQPGKPTWFGILAGRRTQKGAERPGTRDSTLVFGLPGNPVAAFVAFTLFVRPALLALQGASAPEEQQAELATAFTRHPGREQAITVRVEHDDARTVAVPNGPQGSNLISSLLGADALALIPLGTGTLEPGAHVTLIALPR